MSRGLRGRHSPCFRIRGFAHPVPACSPTTGCAKHRQPAGGLRGRHAPCFRIRLFAHPVHAYFLPPDARRDGNVNGDGGIRTRSPSVQARCATVSASSPGGAVSCGGACGRVESNHHSTRRCVYRAVSSPLLSVRVRDTGEGVSGEALPPASGSGAPRIRYPRSSFHRMRGAPACDRATDRIRTGTSRAHDPGCCRYTTITMFTRVRGVCTRGGLRGRRSPCFRIRGLAHPVPASSPSTGCARPRQRTEPGRAPGASESMFPSTRRALSGRQESNLRSPAPEAGGVALSPTASRHISPAGLEPAPSGLRARRLHLFDHGDRSSGGRPRTCVSRVTAARLADSTTPERSAVRGSNPHPPPCRGGALPLSYPRA